MTHQIQTATQKLVGEITLNGSKSISNRVLILRALMESVFPIKGLSNAKDTTTLDRMLKNLDNPLLDAEDAGTTYRFMTAYLAYLGTNQVLMGSKRMCERPIGILVDALNELGANVYYLGREGYPPIQIQSEPKSMKGGPLKIGAGVSSQYISALLMIAPLLPQGLELELDGEIVSRPYIQMTLNLMAYFDIVYLWSGNLIKVPAQDYTPKEFQVEADWSAASYYYTLAALSDKVNLQLNGLYKDSVQGDAIIVDIMENFGILTKFNKKGVRLSKKTTPIESFEYNFTNCPDLAQTVAVLCAALDIPAHLTGLQTLTIKETDRIAALKTELEKLGAEVVCTERSLSIKKGIDFNIVPPMLETYKDHRMAMAFAPLVLKYKELNFDAKDVVNKSYPEFWNDLDKVLNT
ncbi:MAG: 3-phosphoshikimate 1-carboxyvinyltransferase [Aureispira sp.]|nr:3-phosphoshikimate 1-carboxyvinyltransferase [Aureispira sp.]